MVKHKIVKKRINKLAQEMGEFTTKQMYERMYNYPNNEGRLYAKRRRVTMGSLALFLRMDKEIYSKKRYTNGDTRMIWEWIGEEE